MGYYELAVSYPLAGDIVDADITEAIGEDIHYDSGSDFITRDLNFDFGTLEDALEAVKRIPMLSSPIEWGICWFSDNEDDENYGDLICKGTVLALGDCENGWHSWVDIPNKLAPDHACTHCGELYGDPT